METNKISESMRQIRIQIRTEIQWRGNQIGTNSQLNAKFTLSVA